MTLLTSIKRLILEYRASERIHNVHPSNVYDMTKNFSYKESRIIITLKGKLYIADAGKYTHMMMEKELNLNADQNWAYAGHLNIKEGWFYLTEFPGVRNNPIAKELSRILLGKGLRQPSEAELWNEREVKA